MKRDHLSYSQYTSYARCAKAYYLERVAQAPQLPAVYLVAGSAVHAAIEQINLNHVEGQS
jgi:hypothetical protein